MEKNGLVTVIFLFLILSDFSEASLLSNFRKFVAISRVDNSNSVPATPVPSPSPIPEETKSNNKANNELNKGKTPQVSKPKEDPIPERPNETVRASPTPPPPPSLPPPSPPSSPPPPQKDPKLNSGSVTSESCEGLKSCNIQKDLVGCIKSFDQVSKELAVLVQNTGESNLTASLSAEKIQKKLQIPRKRSNRISVTLTNGTSFNISFNSGKNKCDIQFVPPVPEANHFVPPVNNANFFLRFPTYDKLVTPVNGAYLLIFTALIFVGTWACCKFKKRRRQVGGVPYQELEMGIPELESATNVETAEGWDQDWDDDWDEDNAVKSPGGRRVGSISANGLTSRAASKDGWEDNWDD